MIQSTCLFSKDAANSLHALSQFFRILRQLQMRMMFAAMQENMPFNNAETPRKKLSRHGVKALSDSELIAVLLGTGSQGVPVLTLSIRFYWANSGDCEDCFLQAQTRCASNPESARLNQPG